MAPKKMGRMSSAEQLPMSVYLVSLGVTKECFLYGALSFPR